MVNICRALFRICTVLVYVETHHYQTTFYREHVLYVGYFSEFARCWCTCRTLHGVVSPELLSKQKSEKSAPSTVSKKKFYQKKNLTSQRPPPSTEVMLRAFFSFSVHGDKKKKALNITTLRPPHSTSK